jgi:hypothetical protein
MSVRQMSSTQVTQWVKVMEAQGVRVIRTKKGLLLRLPDGTTAMKHYTVSDIRGSKNLASELRRAGIMSPDDNKVPDLPDYITKGTVSETTKERVWNYIRSKGYPTEVYAPAISEACFPKDPAQANRAMYHAGLTPGKAMSKRKGRPWLTPAWLLEEKDNASVAQESPEEVVETVEAEPVADSETQFQIEYEPTHEEPHVHWFMPAPGYQYMDVCSCGETWRKPKLTALDVPPDEGTSEEAERLLNQAMANTAATTDDYKAPEQVAEKNSVEEEPEPELEFIDTRDSWAVDLEEVLGTHLARMVSDRLSVIKAVGLNYEMRVWKEQ